MADDKGKTKAGSTKTPPGKHLGWQQPKNPHYVAPNTAQGSPDATTTPAPKGVMNPGGHMVTTGSGTIPPGLARLAALKAAADQATAARAAAAQALGNFVPPTTNATATTPGAFAPPGWLRKAAYMQGGNRPGSQVPLTANGVPNALALGFGQ
jgi:hypothetical protein